MFDLKTIEGFRSLETPFFYYDTELLRDTAVRLKEEADRFGYILHYALKANANPKVLRLIADTGTGADCVSGGEIERAAECGFDSKKIVYAGVGKSDKEIRLALEKEIFCFNCESVPEIQIINEIAGAPGKTANIALRINPDVHASTHQYITTGMEENKFGINREDLYSVIELTKKLPNINLIGLHFHIGSQITTPENFKSLCLRVNDITRELENIDVYLPHLNLGGGLGVDYDNPDYLAVPDFYSYFNIFNTFLEVRPKQSVHFEPGRAVVANSGSLITRVLYVKEGINTNFAIVDAGMTELIRPALYQARHKIENLTGSERKVNKYDVVGPICESSDCFGKSIPLPEVQRGDIIAIRSAGAYGQTMQSNYNLRPTAPAIYSDEID